MARLIIRKCRKCNSVLPEGAAYCDICGEPVARKKDKPKDKSSGKDKSKGTGTSKGKSHRKANKPVQRSFLGREHIKLLLVIAAVIVVVAFAIWVGVAIHHNLDMNPEAEEIDTSSGIKETVTPSPVEDGLPAMKSRVTAEQYDALQFGMTYDEVVALLGEGGGLEEWQDSYNDTLCWPGEYYGEDCFDDFSRPQILLEFSDDLRLIEMEERNVVDGRTVYENLAEKKTSRVDADNKTVSNIKKGMNYKEIVEILGAMGILTDSQSDNTGFDSKTYSWEFLGEDKYGEEKYMDLEITFNRGKAVSIQVDEFEDWEEYLK